MIKLTKSRTHGRVEQYIEKDGKRFVTKSWNVR